MFEAMVKQSSTAAAPVQMPQHQSPPMWVNYNQQPSATAQQVHSTPVPTQYQPQQNFGLPSTQLSHTNNSVQQQFAMPQTYPMPQPSPQLPLNAAYNQQQQVVAPTHPTLPPSEQSVRPQENEDSELAYHSM